MKSPHECDGMKEPSRARLLGSELRRSIDRLAQAVQWSLLELKNVRRTWSTSPSAAKAPSRSDSPCLQRLAIGYWRNGLVAIALALLVILAFFPILDNGFVEWDDNLNFLENPHFRGLGAPRFVGP